MERERRELYGLLGLCWFILYRKLGVEIGWDVPKHEHVNHVVSRGFFQRDAWRQGLDDIHISFICMHYETQ
jgi:hypothetical protein